MKKSESFFKKIEEPTVLFVSIFKWVVLATITGIIVGIATTIFLKLLTWSIYYSKSFKYYFFLLPVALFFSSFMIKYLAPEAEGHGTEKVIEAIHQRSGRIAPLVVPIKLFATIITLAIGGSAGKEGPCAQIGGGLSSIFATLLKLDNNDRKKLVICGISAGFASVFGTPIAGAIFGVEVLIVGGILYDVLLPSFIAGLMSYQISALFGISYFYHPLKFIHVFTEAFFLKVVLSGVFFGICSFILIEILHFGREISLKIDLFEPFRALIGGVIIVLFTFIFSTKYLGLGLDHIEAYLEGTGAGWYDFLLKSIFTSMTLNFGGSGGMITPVFFVGSSAGSFFARLIGEDISTFAAIGLVSLVAGAANTPIAASIMAVELFGAKIAPYAAVACVISFLMTGHRSIYPSQVLAMSKSASIHVDIGKEIEEAHAHFKPRRKSLIMLWLMTLRKLKKRREKAHGK